MPVITSFPYYMLMIHHFIVAFFHVKQANDVSKLNNELNQIYTWLSSNKLSLNICKTKFMIFTPKNKNEITPVIKINDNRIDRVSEFCFLGVNIDDKMTWNSHINKIATKISRTIGLFHKLKYFLPIFTMRTLYCTLILPHLTYGNLAWGKNYNTSK